MSQSAAPVARRPFAFLTGEWRNLLMLNYTIDPEILRPLVPRGTELDSFDGETYISLVGFLFDRTSVFRLPVPTYRTFEEVNLRFYVKRALADEERRGVVFIRELVPRRMIALIARLAYNEPYLALPMSHKVEARDGALFAGGMVEYGWLHTGRMNRLIARLTGTPALMAPESLEAFITEHYWGYTRQRDGGTVEYQVEHPRWQVWHTIGAAAEVDIATVYGEQYVDALSRPPASAFVAEGSAITVRWARRIA